jgi:hypothetical protein
MMPHGRIRHGTYGVKRNTRGVEQRRTSLSQNGSLRRSTRRRTPVTTNRFALLDGQCHADLVC